MKMERLDKILCDSGVGSRSQVKQILKSGRVTVDGIAEKDGGRKLRPENIVRLDGDILRGKYRAVFMMNKPAGYVTATVDAAERTVMDLLPKELQYLELKPVGRLDKATEGLLLFTNDGDLLHRLISPRNEIPKFYYARHEGCATLEDIEAFRLGIELADGTRCLPAVLKPLADGESEVCICEGKYHQVRRMMASRHLTVTYLERRQEGVLTLDGLPRGAIRELSPDEIALLEQS